MHIKKLTLHLFKRFKDSHISTFIYTPDKKIQIIIGKNGGGKSSLLGELTPLPADLKKFDKGGYKVIELIHNDNYYILQSGIDKGKHNFLFNGKELNGSGNKKRQLELVYEHFNITPMIHDVMLGKKKFTTMSTPERKSWFSLISSVDFTYSIKLYNSLKSSHRDIVGYGKLLSSRLLEIEKDLIGEEEYSYYNRIQTEIHKSIDSLLSKKTSVKEYKNNNKELISISKSIEPLLEYSFDYDELLITKSKLEQRYETITNNIKKLDINIEEKSKETISNSNAIDINNKIKLLKTELNCKKKLYPFNDIPIDEVIEYLLKNTTTIIDIINQEVEVHRDNSSITHLKALQENYLILENKLIKQQLKLTEAIELNNHYNIISKDSHTECPNCTHRWIKDYNTNDHISIKGVIDNYDRDIKVMSNSLSLLKDEIQDIETMYKLNHRLNNILYTNIGKVIQEYKNKHQLSIITVINSFNVLIKDWKLIPIKVKEIENLERELLIVNSFNNDIIKNELEKLNNLLEDNYRELEENKVETLNNNNTLIKANRLKLLNEKLRTSLVLQNKYRNTISKVKMNELIDFHIVELKKQLKIITMQINEVNIIKSKIEDHQETINKNNRDKDSIEKLMLGLSPTEGLIARSMSLYLKNFTTYINDVINSIWSYRMTVLPSVITEDKDLDYKFKVVTSNSSSDDVGLLSSGQMEVCDIAFLLMSMNRLGLSNFPLLLDEFGKSLSTEHRIKAYDLIDSYVTKNNHQIFIISHDKSTYGRFVNSDIVDVNQGDVNLVNSKNYNKCVKIK